MVQILVFTNIEIFSMTCVWCFGRNVESFRLRYALGLLDVCNQKHLWCVCGMPIVFGKTSQLNIFFISDRKDGLDALSNNERRTG